MCSINFSSSRNWYRLFQLNVSDWSFAQTKLHPRAFYFLYFSHIVIVFLCRPIIYHTGVTYSCGDIIITKQLWQLMKINPNMKRSVDILAALFTCTEVSSYGKFWLLDVFTFKSSFLTAKLSLCRLYMNNFVRLEGEYNSLNLMQNLPCPPAGLLRRVFIKKQIRVATSINY